MILAEPTLESEIHQILECIDFEKVQEISREYFENDASIRLLVKYVYSPKFTAAWEAFTMSPEVDDIFEWMGNHGVNVESTISLFSEEVLRIRPQKLRQSMIQNFSIQTYEEEMKEQINFDKLSMKIDELLEAGNDFTHLYLILSVTRPAVENLFERPEIKQVVADLIKLGIDVEGLRMFVYETLRFE